MAFEWQLISNPVNWAQTTNLTFMQTDVSESSITLSIDPSVLSSSVNNDESYRTVLEAIIVAVEAQGFTFAYAAKQEPNMYQLVETEPEV